ncbi:hypothetical protein J1614_004960 [Plenodomus biglobosus]|nr:hypothetical protein J1614_004960 [Plenodomus biglobosus]
MVKSVRTTLSFLLDAAINPTPGLLMQLSANIDGQQDLVLAIAFNEAEHTINALLLGCTKSVSPDCAIAQPAAFDDLKFIETFMYYAKASAAHPLLLCCMVADLQLKRFQEKNVAVMAEFRQIQRETGLSCLGGPRIGKSPSYMTPNTGGPVDYNSITRNTLHLYTQFEHSTLDMTRFHKILAGLASSLSEMDYTLCKTRRKYLRKHGLRILQQTKNIQDEMLHLINKSKSNTT